MTSVVSASRAGVGSVVTVPVINGAFNITGVGVVFEAAPVLPQTINLAGNLGGASHYGKLSYGLKPYSRISAFAPVFSGSLDNSLRNVSGGFAPVISFTADLQVARLVLFGGGLAPQIALGGSLSLDLPLNVLVGGLTPNIVLGASSFISGPLWADTDPCPSAPWALSDPCPPPPWMTSAPCGPVVWSKSRMCNG